VHSIYSIAATNRKNGIPDFLDPDVLTVADVLSDAGYATEHIGKWHICGRAGGPPPGEYGFGSWLVSNPPHVAAPVYRERMKNSEHSVSESSRWMVDDAIDFMSGNRGSEKPFFINLCFLAPHSPLKPTPEEFAVYEDLRADPEDFSSWMKGYAADAEDLTEQMKVYCATMTGMDRQIGRLLDYLDENGLFENTLVLFTSDNGPEDYHVGNSRNAGVGSPGELRGRKRSPYLGGMRVPMIVRWPGVTPAGKENPAVWSAVDFLPTMAAVAGSALPAEVNVDGENCIDALKGGATGRQNPLFWEWKFPIFGNQEYAPPQVCMLDGKWWAGWQPDGSRVELYDISADPQQRKNLNRKFPEVTEKMVSSLKAWKAEIPERYDPPIELPRHAASAGSFAYSANIPSAPKHPDTDPPSKLSDGRYAVAGKDSVQFNQPVSLVLDLGAEKAVESITLHAFQRLGDFVVRDFELLFSDDGKRWVAQETVVNRQADVAVDRVALKSTKPVTARYIKLNVRKAPGAKRILLGEIEIGE
jgi:N-acetylgalactosamine-6-sulfatase